MPETVWTEAEAAIAVGYALYLIEAGQDLAGPLRALRLGELARGDRLHAEAVDRVGRVLVDDAGTRGVEGRDEARRFLRRPRGPDRPGRRLLRVDLHLSGLVPGRPVVVG